jgi:hypothetical protein
MNVQQQRRAADVSEAAGLNGDSTSPDSAFRSTPRASRFSRGSVPGMCCRTEGVEACLR